MTRRATLTQAELARAIRAADATGKVALRTPYGIAFVDPAQLAQPAPIESGGNTCDTAFGVAEP
jgi:hypothetical protein